MAHPRDLDALDRALVQTHELLTHVSPDRLTDPTPCSGWTLGDLVDHVVAAPARFSRMVRGEQVDWSGITPRVDDPARMFRTHASGLRAAWLDPAVSQAAPPPDWQLAELAVHTWDLAHALHQPTASLDPEVAERGLAFMRSGLTEENRSPAFGPEQPAPEDGDAYDRIAAFAGRKV